MNVLQALITAILSGLCAGFVTFALNERRDRSELRLKKLEETAEAAHAYVDFLATRYVTWANSLVLKQITPQDMLSYDGSDADRRDVLRTKATLMVSIWSPQSVPQLDDLMRHVLKLSQYNLDIQMAILRSESTENMIDNQGANSRALIESKNKLVSNIVLDAQNIAARPSILDEVRTLLIIKQAQFRDSFDW